MNAVKIKSTYMQSSYNGIYDAIKFYFRNILGTLSVMVDTTS